MTIRFNNAKYLLRALEMCEHFGYLWRSRQKPTYYYPFIVRYFGRYSFVYLSITDKIITYDYGNGYGDVGDNEYEQSITANEFFNTFKQKNGVYILN